MPNDYLDKVNLNGTTYDIKDTVSGYTSNSGTVTGVKINNETKSPTSGIVDLGAVLSSYTETDPTVPSWAKASQKPTYTATEVGAIAITAVGASSGVAPLNASSKIDESYLPSYVDDVIEGYYYNNKFWKESSHTTEITGEAGKIYVDLSTDKTYRFGGTSFVEISSGTTVSVTRDLTTGTKIATITINGTGSSLYAPTPPSKVSELSNDSGFISGITSANVTNALGYTPYNSTNPNGYVNAAGASAAAPVQSVNGQTGNVTIDDEVMYVTFSGTTESVTASKTPQQVYEAYQSGKTVIGVLEFQGWSGTILSLQSASSSSSVVFGALFLDDIGYDYALEADAYMILSTSSTTWEFSENYSEVIRWDAVTDVINSSSTDYQIPTAEAIYNQGYVKSSEIPVTSVNSKTGAVTLSASDVGALPSSTVIPTVTNTYSSTGTNAVSGTAVYSALQTLDSSITATTNSAISAITITDGKITASSKIAVPTVTSTYASNGTNAVNGTAVYSALQTLDSSITATANSAISAITITDGKISSSSKIAVPSKVSDLTNDAAYISLGDLPIYDGTVT